MCIYELIHRVLIVIPKIILNYLNLILHGRARKFIIRHITRHDVKCTP